MCSPTEKLNCIRQLLNRCEQWLAAESSKQAIPAHRVLDTWLFESKEQWQQRYQAKQKVRERLQQLYQKQLALLSSHTLLPCPFSHVPLPFITTK